MPKHKTGGRATYKGVNAQSWAALSLFLQHVRRPDFDHIAFEQYKLKDFDLVFTDGRKIICESKSNKVTLSVIRTILKSLANTNSVNRFDEILIVCKSLSPELKSFPERIKYMKETKQKLKRNGFGDVELDLFKKVKFWQVDQETNQRIVESLLAEILGIWVPDNTFNEIVSDLLLGSVYEGSEKGEVLTRSDFYKLIDNRKKQIQIDAGYRNEEKQKLDRIDRVLSLISDPNNKNWCNNEISLLTTTPDLYFLAIRKLENTANIKLSQWDSLWKASAKGVFSIHIFDIFKKNIEDPDNREYVVSFLPNILKNILSFYRQEFIVVDIEDICSKILDDTRTFDNDIFNILKVLLHQGKNNIFYSEKNVDRSEWETEEVTKTLKKLYELADETIKNKIVSFIFDSFDLIGDDGEFWHYTPRQIFEIIRLYIESDIEDRILNLTSKLSKQFEEFYKSSHRSLYKGWELMGFTNTDRHFITYVLKPVLENYFSANPEAAWQFVTNTLITRDEPLVSVNRPDFLNRACVSVLFRACQNPNYHDEALEIIKDFVEMKKGIPHKTELVYKELAGSSLSDDDKWKIVKYQLEFPLYKELPVNKSVENIVSELANNDNAEALAVIEKWSRNPEYNKFRGILEGNITSLVPGLLNNAETQKKGINILRKFLSSPTFIEKQGLWEVWDTAKVLTLLLDKNFEEAKSIILSIWSKGTLTRNEQVVITAGINGVENNDDLVKRTFNEIISVWLDEVDDNINSLISKVPEVQSRISIVQFGDKLAKARSYEAAIRIAKMFINDPDPGLGNSSDDPEGKFNYHEQVKEGKDVNQITTVRAYVAWLLQSVGVLYGRQYIPEIIPLVEKLTNDPNYYVRAYSCIPLEQLARVRHTVLPTDNKVRFLDLKEANKIEKIAYKMLRNKENWSLEQVMVGILRVFSNVRTVTTSEAKEILGTFLKTKNYKVIEEARVLFIYFAEFRKKSINFRKLRYVYNKHRLDQLKNFDDEYFKNLLVKILKNYPDEVKGGFTWAFWHLTKEEGTDREIAFNIAFKYLKILAKSYSHEVMTDIYYFIDEFIETKTEESLDLWKDCLKVERPYLKLKVTKQNLYEMNWWPFHYNGKILCKIQDDDEFLKWTEFLACYPEGVTIANDLNLIIDRLSTLPVTNESKKIFGKLAAQNPEYFERYKKWSTQP